MNKFDCEPNALKTSDNISFYRLLTTLCSNAKMWVRVKELPAFSISASDLDLSDKKNISNLFNASESDWRDFCTAAGWTVYGAVALSWCEGAELDQVWEGWEASGFPLLPKPEYERPARFINPALLPETNSLKELATIAENKSLPLCAMIVALQDKPLEFDLPEAQLRSASPQIAAFLKQKMEAQGGGDPELIAIWSETIKGTEYA